MRIECCRKGKTRHLQQAVFQLSLLELPNVHMYRGMVCCRRCKEVGDLSRSTGLLQAENENLRLHTKFH